MRLTNFARNHYSQFGEDGIIQHIFKVIGTTNKRCMEFGAGDGLSCSNVANLWKNGWTAELIEVDLERFQELQKNIDPKRCSIYNLKIEPSGENSLDELFDGSFDFLSIDIDGNDLYVWQRMKLTPRVICIEFNPTVPPDIVVYQEYTEEDMGFGSSLRALINHSGPLGYTFIGATHCNAFFVLSSLAESFENYDKEIEFSPTYLVTDFKGNAVAVGSNPPWGIKAPYVGPNLLGEVLSGFLGNPEDAADLYQEVYGNGIHWVQGDRWPNIANPDEAIDINARKLLNVFMETKLSPICLEIAHVSSLSHLDWIRPLAETHEYQFRVSGGIVALVKN